MAQEVVPLKLNLKSVACCCLSSMCFENKQQMLLYVSDQDPFCLIQAGFVVWQHNIPLESSRSFGEKKGIYLSVLIFQALVLL